MPKTIRTRNAIGLLNYATSTGHIKSSIKPIINAVIEYTTVAITNQINNISDQIIPTTNVINSIIQQNDTINTVLQNNIEIVNNTINEKYVEVSTIPNIPELEIKKIYQEFVYPYLTVGAYKLPPFSEFQRIISIIDEELIGVKIDEDYKLRLYKGILDILVRGRSIYFYDLQLETENKMLRTKICNLEELVMKYSTELALCNGSDSGFYMAGSIGIRLHKPKNLIYAQALLNINLAWYIYLYNTKKIEYDNYQGVIEYIKEKGKKNAYDELVKILDEKFKDIEDEMHNKCNQHDHSSNYSSNDCTSDSKSQTYSSSGECLSQTDSFSSKYEDELNYCKVPHSGTALMLSGFLSITQPNKFCGISSMVTNQLKIDYCNIDGSICKK